MRRKGNIGVALVAIVALATPAGTTASADGDGSQNVAIRVLSNRADLISGGDALVSIVLPAGASIDDLTVAVDGRDVTSVFAEGENGPITGLVDGLKDGSNRLVARLADGRGARITITNHPIGGPVFSGPQVQPWACSTVQNLLGPPLDEQCNAAPIYREVVLDNGVKVGIERGTMNRGIYDLAMPANWNHKLVWFYGGGCDQLYDQGTPFLASPGPGFAVPPGPGFGTATPALEKGFAVAAHSMTEPFQHCNDVTMAESIMMLHEYIEEHYGRIRYAIGEGASGGAMVQNHVSANYPGLLDGVQPGATFADFWTGGSKNFADCALLLRYFDSSPLWSDDADRAAASGHGETNTGPCEQGGGAAARYLHAEGHNQIPCAGDATYDKETNPEGVRCSMQDYEVAVFGKRPDGFARRPYDNVGVQYGLDALEAGDITPEQFVEMNENIGGYDIDLNWQPQRSEADLEAVRIAYRTGRVPSGRHQAKAAMIYRVNTNNNDYHLPVSAYHTQARLRRDNGTDANQVLWTSPPSDLSSLDTIDAWLSAVKKDHRRIPLARKIIENRPPEAVDACWVDGERITSAKECRKAYPYFETPRMAAGGGMADDVMKCHLKPLRRSDYSVEFTDERWAALQKTFPIGVCDYSKPGVGQRTNLPWMTFEDGPGGRPLGPPPRSVPFTSGA